MKKNKYIGMVALLLSGTHMIDANLLTSLEATLSTHLINAAKADNLARVKKWLKDGANVNAKENGKGFTALIWASQKGYKDIVAELLKAPHIDVNVLGNNGAGDSVSALMMAAAYGYLDIVNMLLKAPGINVKLKDSYGSSAMGWANGTVGNSPAVNSPVRAKIKDAIRAKGGTEDWQ